MRVSPILLALGIMLTLLGLAMIPSALIDFFDRADATWPVFGLSSFAAIFVGVVMALAVGGNRQRTGAREAFVLTVLVWILLPIVAAIPFVALGFSWTDSLFESVSGLTTTGATIATELDSAPRGFLLWRAVLQWIGGVGIIVTAIAILPMLRVGGMQLFQLESSDVTGKFLPRLAEISTQIALIYVSFSLVCAFLYMATGMNAFDAFAHAMTTMAAGGFSTHDESFSYFAGDGAVWVAIVFMVLASLPFGAFVLMTHGRMFALMRDPQPRLFMAIILGASLLMMAYLLLNGAGFDLTFVRNTLFNVISVTTGTGYAVSDYGAWGGFAETLLLLLMFVGGCAGSAACGIKIFRIEITFRAILAYTQKAVRPNRISPVRYGGRVVVADTLQSVMIFLFLYFATFVVSAILLTLTGLDTLTAISGAATSVSNVGPGLGGTIGPTGTFQSLPDAAKWICLTAMLLGRLEFVAVFVVLTPRFWRG